LSKYHSRQQNTQSMISQYSCNVCKTYYTNKRNLEDHFLTNKHKENTIHGGPYVKKFECKTCDIEFYNNKDRKSVV
jgi:hypothetical protein